MAIRTDIISIDWSTSPREVLIAISETEVNVQDLYDTCKHYEALPSGVDELFLCDAGGKEPLGGGVLVGITVSLFNTVYVFADRPGPDWVICNMTGGNVVGFTDDTRTTELYPRKPSSYVSADRSSSSSATQSELDAIQYSSYQNAVWLDVEAGTPGQAFPIGTREYPSNNVIDAVAIADTKGFDTINFVHDLILTTGHDVSNMHLVGNGKSKSMLTIMPDALTADCHVTDCTITGTMDGDSEFAFCSVKDVFYVNGAMYKCLLEPGTITLGNNSVMHALECDSGVPGTDTPTIDMGGSGQSLGMRGYDGGIKLTNKTGPESVSIDLSSGQVKIDLSTVLEGTIIVRGVGKVIEATTGENMPSGLWGNLVLLNETINGIQQHEMWQMMGLDIDAPVNGETPGEILVGDIKQNISDNGDGTGTITREF